MMLATNSGPRKRARSMTPFSACIRSRGARHRDRDSHEDVPRRHVGVGVMRAFVVALCLLGVLAQPLTAAASMRLDDADLVVVLPSVARREARQMKRLLGPWARRVRRQYRETVGRARLKISYVSLSDLVPDGTTSAIGAEDVRQFLRHRFSSRPTTTERPRYLAIAALPYAEYAGPSATVQLPIIPRFTATLRDVPGFEVTQTDVPYGFLTPDTIDGGDGFVDPADLDMRTATFTVFRIPLAQIDDLRHFVDRANAFAAAPHRNDVALVSGEFGLFPVDP